MLDDKNSLHSPVALLRLRGDGDVQYLVAFVRVANDLGSESQVKLLFQEPDARI